MIRMIQIKMRMMRIYEYANKSRINRKKMMLSFPRRRESIQSYLKHKKAVKNFIDSWSRPGMTKN